MDSRESILQKIVSAGYTVSGGRDAMSYAEDSPLVVTARNDAAGQRHTVTVHTRGDEGEVEALRQLAEKIGIGMDGGC
jgi:D-tyrosyl-tRNA(Tyr) deacylase